MLLNGLTSLFAEKSHLSSPEHIHAPVTPAQTRKPALSIDQAVLRSYIKIAKTQVRLPRELSPATYIWRLDRNHTARHTGRNDPL
jgi:hypothetical protein